MRKRSCFFHTIVLLELYFQCTRASIIVNLVKPRKILPAQKESSSAELEQRVQDGFLTAVLHMAEKKGLHVSLANKYGEAPLRDTMRSIMNSLDQHRYDSDERIQEGIEEVLSQNLDFYFDLVSMTNKTILSSGEFYDYGGTKHQPQIGEFIDGDPYDSQTRHRSFPLLWIIPALIIVALLGTTFFFAYRKKRTVVNVLPRIIKARVPRSQLNDESSSQMEEV